MFQRLNHNKQVFDTELSSIIPNNVSTVLQINKDKKTKYLIDLLEPLGTFINSVEDFLSYPLYIICQKKDAAMIAKMTIQQEVELKNQLDHVLFPSYPPKERVYKDATILFYSTTDNSFFCCTFYNGIFIASYNYKLIEEIMDADSNKNSFFANKDLQDLSAEVKLSYPANLYFRDNNEWSLFNISINQDSLILEGFAKADSLMLLEDNDATKIYRTDQSIVPNELLAYQVNTNKDIISDTLNTMFDLPTYQFDTNNSVEPIYALKLKVDKFVVYNLLNSMEQKYIGRKFNIHDFAFGNQRIYTASLQLSKSIFKKDEIVYFTFYKNHLIFSTNKKSLISYLINSGKNKNDTIPNISNNYSLQIESIFYSSKPEEIISKFVDTQAIIFKDSCKSSIFIKTYRQNDTKKIDIIVNNIH